VTTLRIGTRSSRLARIQSQLVADRLSAALAVDTELVAITTTGDADGSSSLTEIGGQGVFVGAVRQAVVAGEVDLAVHSLKDLPTLEDPRLVLAAVPAREDPRDALVARDRLALGELPHGSRLGTGSPRRAAQVLALGLGLDIVPIRGNVETRLRTVYAGDLDAVVLARAGLVRLGLESEITENLDPIQVLPAPGQGALAVEVSRDNARLCADVAAALDHSDTRAAVTAERALLRTLEAGCTAPVGALADVVDDDGPTLWLRAVACAPDGSGAVRLSAAGPLDDAAALGHRLAGQLLAEGAAGLMREPAS
jgi:hydroxymethylbilane synthase